MVVPHIRSMNFSVAGTGNAAWHFTRMLLDAGHHLLQVYSRSDDKANAFTAQFGGISITHADEFFEQNDLIILAVSDSAIEEVALAIPRSLTVAHTSGASPISLLPHEHRAVIWPLQTLTEGVELDYSAMPLCIEPGDAEVGEQLRYWFGSISSRVQLVNGDQRAHLHLAAVWACNFSNLMYRISHKIAKEHALDPTLLHPLIEETARKIQSVAPAFAQTGPAHRGDWTTIRAHMDMLQEEKALMNIYRLLTEQIMNHRYDHEL